MTDDKKRIAILGGTGKEGKGIGYRWAKYGHHVIIGSRKQSKAEFAAEELNQILGKNNAVAGKENSLAAQEADIIVITVPYAAHKTMCSEMKEYVQNKIVIDVTVPLVPPKVTKVQMPPEGSATMEAKKIFGDDVRVVAALQNISYEHLLKDEEVLCDVLVAGDTKEAREIVIGLMEDAGLTAWDAGVIENSMVIEGLTSVLIGLNKKYGVSSSGIKITGIDK